MASTTFNGPVRSEKGFQVATKNATTGAVTTRMSSAMPDLTGLAKADVATGASLTLAADTMSIVNYTGAAAAGCTLPAATQGTVVVYVQAKDTAGGVNTLVFDAAGRVIGVVNAIPLVPNFYEGTMMPMSQIVMVQRLEVLPRKTIREALLNEKKRIEDWNSD